MSRSSNERVSEEEKLLNRLMKQLSVLKADFTEKEIDYLVSVFNWYADEMIKLMFKQEEQKREGKIRIRTENGIAEVDDESLAGGTKAGGII